MTSSGLHSTVISAPSSDRDRADHGGEAVARHEGRRPSTDEDGLGDRESRLDGPGDLGAQRLQVRLDEMPAIGPGGERAVLALRRAERDVHVHPESRQPLGGRRRQPGQAVRDEEEVERGEALGHLIDRNVEHGCDRTGVVATDGDHATVEVLTLDLDESQVARQHLERRSLELHELGDVDRQLLVGRRLQRRGRLRSRHLPWEQLLDRHGVELRQSVEARHRQRPLAALVGTEDRRLELLVRLRLHLLQGHPLLLADDAQAFADLSAVDRGCFFVDECHMGIPPCCDRLMRRWRPPADRPARYPQVTVAA